MIFATTKQRIMQYLDFKGISVKEFLQETSIKRGFLDSDKMNSAVSDVFLAKIIAIYKDLDLQWLISGIGEMLKPEVEPSQYDDHSFEAHKVAESKALYGNAIPLVSVKVIGGFGNNDFAISEMDVKDRYVIPKFQNKKIDFMIEVEGASMYPKYSSGDVVACTIINEKTFIQWNKTHVIATKEQGIIIKRIKQGSTDDKLCMISDNDHYDPFEVPKSEITGIALVVGVIRLE